MLHNTRGIVFHQIKYTDNSVIVTIYTDVFGLQTYMIRGIRSKKSGFKPALLQPLSIVDLIVYHKERSDLQHIREITSNYPFRSVPFDIVKSSIVLFLSEVLYKSIKEVEPNSGLFKFLSDSIRLLDNTEAGKSIFHFIFLFQLTRSLGFFPNKEVSAPITTFNLMEGTFNKSDTQEQFYIRQPFSNYIYELINSGFEDLPEIKIPQNHRSELLTIILKYYEVHLSGFGNIKSHKVLQQILSD